MVHTVASISHMILQKMEPDFAFETEDSVIPNENKHKGSRLVSIVVGWEF